jgi:hypothetical protein
MIAAAIILAVLLLLSFLRIGVIAEYGDFSEDTGSGAEDTDGSPSDIRAFAVAGPLKFKLYPTNKVEKEKHPKKKSKEGAAKAGRLASLKEQIPAIKTLLSRLRRKLLIRELTIYYMAAGDDPAAAALWFGGANIGYGFLTALIENNFRIKKRDFRASVSFEKTEPYIYVRARLSLAVWEAIYVAWALLKSFLRRDKTATEIRKAV